MVAILSELLRSPKASPKLVNIYAPFIGFAIYAILQGLLPNSVSVTKPPMGRKRGHKVASSLFSYVVSFVVLLVKLLFSAFACSHLEPNRYVDKHLLCIFTYICGSVSCKLSFQLTIMQSCLNEKSV